MNEQLKFSWGHIIAFLALIVLSYITFVGEKDSFCRVKGLLLKIRWISSEK